MALSLARAAAVVPTLGLSPWLTSCLEALHREGLEVVVVDQGETPAEIAPGLAARVLRPGRNLGFAAANNLAWGEILRDSPEIEALATVNDDAVVEEGWAGRLLEALETDPRVAAAQGVNVALERPEIADGRGLEWNRWWQAVQIGHGEAAPGLEEDPREVFGVSATAAFYRRSALEAVAGPGFEVFDPRLGSYYEDVDLACRLRRAGWRSLSIPAARARHAGSASGARLPLAGRPLIYGNRWLVAARYLGRGFWWRLPWIWLRDAADLSKALSRGELAAARGIAAGWVRAARRLHHFAHLGVPLF